MRNWYSSKLNPTDIFVTKETRRMRHSNSEPTHRKLANRIKQKMFLFSFKIILYSFKPAIIQL